MNAFLREHAAAVRQNRRGAALLLLFCAGMGVGIWLGTFAVDIGLRIFLVFLGVVTMLFCGIGYLFPDDES